MKKITYFILSGIILMIFSCDDDLPVYKEKVEPIDPVINLNYSIADDAVTLTWELPVNYPGDIITPVSVQVTVFRDGVTLKVETISDAPINYTYSEYDSERAYRFVVKVRGNVHEDPDNPFKSSVRLSPGRWVEL